MFCEDGRSPSSEDGGGRSSTVGACLCIGESNRMVMPNRLNWFSLQPIIDSKPIDTYLYT